MSRRRTKVIFALLLVLAAAVAWPVTAHYRAKWRVEDYKRQLQAAGERLTFAQLIPILPTDGPNGALPLQIASGQLNSMALSNLPSTMKWAAPGRAIVSWKEDPLPTSDSTNVWPVLSQVVNSKQETVADIRAALDSPVLSFNLNYQQGFNLALPHLARMKGAAQWLTATMLVELHQNHPTNAWENLKALAALVQRYRDEPLMISELVRIAIGAIALNATWEALQSGDWRDEQLAELQTAWQSVDLLAQAESVLAMERLMGEQTFAQFRESYTAVANTFGSGSGSSGLSELAEMGKELVDDPQAGLKSLAHRYPGYWMWKCWQSYDDELANMQAFQAGIRAARTAREEQALGPALKQFDQELTRLQQAHPKAGRWFGYALLDAEGIQRFLSRIRTLEIQRALLVTALALQRYQLKHGAYPPELAALAPAFLNAVPRDAMDGKPLRYRLKPDGSFLLYSVGEDGEDNGGDATPAKDPKAAKHWWQARDAVWPQPASREEVDAYFKELVLERKKAEAQAASINSATEAGFRKRYGLPPLPASPPAATNTPDASQSGGSQTNSGANSPK